MERLRQDAYIFYIKEISVNGIDDIYGLFIEIYDIQSEEYFALFADDVFLFFAVDKDTIDVDHNPFAIDIMMFFCGLAFFFDDFFEIIIREFFVERLENIKPEKRKSAFIEHEIMAIFGVFS